MKNEIKSSILIIIILSTLFYNWNYELSAGKQRNELDDIIKIRTISNTIEEFYWGQSEVISEPFLNGNININESYEPKIAVENDKIYVVWEDGTDLNGAGSDYDIFYRYYNGSKWSKIQVISEPVSGDNKNIASSYSPDIAVENGNIYVVWNDANNTNGSGTDSDIFYRCNLTGTYWEDIQVISEPVIGNNINNLISESPEIAVENGKIYVIWSDFTNISGAGNDRDIFYRYNLTGSNWEYIQVISEPVPDKNFNTGISNLPVISVDNGKIYVVWEDTNNTYNAGIDWDIFYRCNLTGADWEPVQVISEPLFNNDINIVSSVGPSVAVENSNIYVVWQDSNNTNDAGWDYDIFFRCNLTGNSWEEVQVISEPVAGRNFNTQTSHAPSITVENCKIYIVWDDENNTNGAGTDADIFFKCNVTGSTWEAVQVISEPEKGNNFNNGWSYFSDIAVNQNKSHVVWQDSNDTNGAGNSDLDILYCRTLTPSVLNFPNVSPTSGNTSTEFNFTVTYTNIDNNPPQKIRVHINNKKYSLLETDSHDINYCDGKKYYYNITHLNIGLYVHEFWVYDGTFINSTLKVNKPIIYNTPPEIITANNRTAIEDTYYEVEYEYEDLDVANVGQSISWNYSSNASWLAFDIATAMLKGTPANDDVGEYWVNIIINDTIDFDSTNFTLTVLDVNDNPIINTTNVKVTYEDVLYFVDYNAIDIDSPINEQVWSLKTNVSSWLDLDSATGILDGIPTNDEVGVYWVNISVVDGEGGLDFANFTLIVINVNDPPVITTEDIVTGKVGELYEVDYNATDIDSPLSRHMWFLETNASWLTINPLTGVLHGVPLSSYLGWYNVNVTIDDGDGGQDWHAFTLIITRNNTAPIITTTDIVTATVDEFYYVDYEAIDDYTPSDEFIWALETDANWLSIDPNTGFLSGIPEESNIGDFWVNISVCDTEGGFAYHDFILTVTMLKIEHPPELSDGIMTPSSGNTITEFTFSVHYFDADNNTPLFIQIIIDDLPYYMELKAGENATDGVYIYITKLSKGQHTYYFTASDGMDTVKTENFTTPYIRAVSKERSQELQIWEWVIFIIVLIVIITLIATILINQVKKKDVRKKELEMPLTVPVTPPPPPPPQQSLPPIATPQRQVIKPKIIPSVVQPVPPKIELLDMQSLEESIEE